MAARYDDLDLNDAEDRVTYRLRVGREYEMMSIRALFEEAKKVTGKRGADIGTTRTDAYNAIANHRIASITGA